MSRGSKFAQNRPAAATHGHDDFRERVGNHAAFGKHAHESLSRDRPAAQAIDMRAAHPFWNITLTAATAAGDTAIGQLDNRNALSENFNADRNRLAFLSQHSNIAAGVDDCTSNALRPKALDRTIHSISLCNTAKIDPDRTP